MNAERLAEIRELAAKTQSAVGMECLACIDELRAQLEAQRGGAVVVAEMMNEDVMRILVEFGHDLDIARIEINKWFRENSRAVDASQVLQPGMVGVDAGVLELLGIFFDQRLSVEWEPEKVRLDDLDRWAKESRKAVAEYRALRSQAGGEG